MRLLILGGGYGTRLFGRYNLSNYVPKGLVSIAGRPSIEHSLSAFSDSLLEEIIISTNREGTPFYSGWARKSRFGHRIEIFTEKFSKPEACLGVLQSLEIVNEYYEFNEPILILAPDNVFNGNLDAFIQDYKDGVSMVTYRLKEIREARKYGVVTLKNKNMVACHEKPARPTSNHIRTSCEIWSPEAFAHLKRWNKEFEPDKVGDFINYLIEKGIMVYAFPFKGIWMDIGTQQDLAEARKVFGEQI